MKENVFGKCVNAVIFTITVELAVIQPLPLRLLCCCIFLLPLRTFHSQILNCHNAYFYDFLILFVFFVLSSFFSVDFILTPISVYAASCNAKVSGYQWHCRNSLLSGITMIHLFCSLKCQIIGVYGDKVISV